MNSRPIVFRFTSGSVTPSSADRNRSERIAVHQLDIEPVAERAHHLLCLAGTQQPVIDEDAGQLIADRLMDQHRRDG